MLHVVSAQALAVYMLCNLTASVAIRVAQWGKPLPVELKVLSSVPICGLFYYFFFLSCGAPSGCRCVIWLCSAAEAEGLLSSFHRS